MIEIVARARCQCGRTGPEVTQETRTSERADTDGYMSKRAHGLALGEGWGNRDGRLACPACLNARTETHPCAARIVRETRQAVTRAVIEAAKGGE